MHFLKYVSYFFLSIFLLAWLPKAAGGNANTPPPPGSQRGNGMQFIENKGQIVDMNNHLRPDILFAGDGGGMQVYLRKGGLSYVLSKRGEGREAGDESVSLTQAEEKETDNKQLYQILDTRPSSLVSLQLQRIDLDFLNSNPNVDVLKSDQVEGYLNYYYAHCPKGVTNVHGYNRVVYLNVYPNIDIVFYGNKEHGLKYDIVIRPGGNPADIKLKYTGADGVEIINDKLRIVNSLGLELTEKLPKVYQNINGRIVDVPAKYILTNNKSKNPILHFQFSIYNSSFSLVVDPWITYYGGSDDDDGSAIAVDNNGNVLATGTTASTNFPVTPGAFQTSGAGLAWFATNSYVVKFDPNGARLWATYFGGSRGEFGYGIATDASGDIVVTGETASIDFPVSPGAFQSSKGTIYDAFIFKLAATGNRLWATYYGGTGSDYGYDVAVDAANEIVVTGKTDSNNFPLSASPFQTTSGGQDDAFIVKFASNGTRLWATYYGGNSVDVGAGVSTTSTNEIVITGATMSPNFPVSPGAFKTLFSGGFTDDAFIVKMDANGSRLWATFYGTVNFDKGISIDVDNTNEILLAGWTRSAIFPITPGAFQTALSGGMDSFLAKFNASGFPIWATYLGTADNDLIFSCATDMHNNIYVLWEEEDAPASFVFPTYSCGYQKTCGGIEDLIITKFDTRGNHLCDTYIGGPAEDDLDKGKSRNLACYKGDIFLIGSITGTGFPVTPGAFQTYYAGGGTTFGFPDDAAIAKLCGISCGDPFLTNISISASDTNVCVGGSVNFNIQHPLPSCDTLYASYEWTFTGASTSFSTAKNPINIIYPNPGFFPVKVKMTNDCGVDSVEKLAYIEVIQLAAHITTSLPPACNGGSNGALTVSASGSTASYTYQWNNGQTSAALTNLVAGSYSVMVSDANNCTAIANTVLTQPVILSATTSSTTATCGNNNGTATVNPAGGTPTYTYLWSGILQSTQSVTGLAAGTYTISVTDANGCSLATLINMSSGNGPSLVLQSQSNVTCNGMSDGKATVIGAGGFGTLTYHWNNGSTTTAVTGLATGMYTVTVTDANNCSQTQSLTITQPTALSVTTSSTSPTCGSSNGTITVNASGGTGNYTYLWLGTAQSTQTATGLASGSYSITVSDTNNCVLLSAVTISNTNGPSVIIQSQMDVSCNGLSNGSATASGLGGSGNLAYLWTSATGGGQTGTTATGLASGTYSLTVTDNNNCSSSVTVAITQPSPLIVNSNPSMTICSGQIITITAGTQGGTPAYIYSWNSGQSASSGASIINQQPTSNSIYTVSVTDSKGCTASANTSVTVNSLPLISFSSTDTSGCAPLCVTLTNHTLNSINIIWQVEPGVTLNGNAVNHCYSTPGNYNVSLTSTDANGCSNTLTKTNFISVFPTPVAQFSATPPIGTLLDPTIYFSDQSQLANSWYWSFGDVNNSFSSQQHPQFSYADTGVYVVTLMVTNLYGCMDTATQLVIIQAEYSVYIPNTFTPNGDGINDFFFPGATGVDKDNYELWIFDRWGNLIYESKNYYKPWDGRANGGKEIVQQDTYVYKINIKDIFGTMHRYVGHVNIIK